MYQVAKTNLQTFALAEVNGIDITIGATGQSAYRLGSGEFLHITQNGAALTVADPAKVIAAYEYGNASGKGDGLAYAVNQVLSQLPPSQDPALGGLMQNTDALRSQSAGDQLKMLLAGAPDAASKGAPDYMSPATRSILSLRRSSTAFSSPMRGRPSGTARRRRR
jgi:hypothetical protein